MALPWKGIRLAVLLGVASGCGGSPGALLGSDAGCAAGHCPDAGVPLPDAGCPAGQAVCGAACVDILGNDAHCGACTSVCTGGQHCAAGACRASAITHVVLIVEENHTFDAYFGRYCQAPAGSNPTCTAGPSCCEAAPALEPHGASPILLDDAANFATDRDHDQACELQQINDGGMDGFVTGSTGASTCLGTGPNCSSPNNFALADATTMGTYWGWAGAYALADRYFQPVAGGSASNDMYFAGAQSQFADNSNLPNAIGDPHGCLQGACDTGTVTTFSGRTTIADLLLQAGKTFAVYADGFAAAQSAAPACEPVPADCTYDPVLHPIAAEACKYDSSDIPFVYYAQFADSAHVRDYAQLAQDLDAGVLPQFAFVKGREFHNEHPNVSTISDGVAFVNATFRMIQASALASDTLVLLTWDEGGGFFDHVPPPATIEAGAPYGTRVPLLVLGRFARAGTVSHVALEHSSIVKFLEYNFLGPTGQLGHRDAQVNNLGSLLDPAATGVPIP